MSKQARKKAQAKWRAKHQTEVSQIRKEYTERKKQVLEEDRKQGILEIVETEGPIGSVALREWLPYDVATCGHLIMSLAKEGKLWYEKRTVTEDGVEKRRFFVGIPGKHELTNEFPEFTVCGGEYPDRKGS